MVLLFAFWLEIGQMRTAEGLSKGRSYVLERGGSMSWLYYGALVSV